MRRLFTLIALLAALPVVAQTKDLQPLPAVPPPPPGMEAFDAALEPQVNIVQGDQETREEFRIKGKLYMIKVTPAVGKPYYLIDRKGDGSFVESDTVVPVNKPPMWILHSW